MLDVPPDPTKCIVSIVFERRTARNWLVTGSTLTPTDCVSKRFSDHVIRESLASTELTETVHGSLEESCTVPNTHYRALNLWHYRC